MRVGIALAMCAFLIVSTGCNKDGADKPTKKDPPPVVQEMNIVQPDSDTDDK